MAYIGREPQVGNFQVCDAISVVNGQAAYTMQVDSTNVSPETANHMIVSLNGVLQKPGSSFTVSGSTITFASNLVTGDVIDFIHILGSVLDLGTPSDATVTNAKTNFVSTSSAAGLQIKGDGTTDGTLQLNCSQNSHGIKLASPAHSAGQSYTLTFPTGNVTADKFLKVASVSGSGTTGIGQLSFDDAGGGNLRLLQTQTVSSAVSSVDFTSNIDSTYKAYKVQMFDINPETDAQYLYVRMGSGSFDSGSNYKYLAFGGQDNSGSRNQNASSGDSSTIRLHANEIGGASATDQACGEFTLFSPSNTSKHKGFIASLTGNTQAGHGIIYLTGGVYKNTSAVDRIQFYMSSGNIGSAVFKLYGIL
jgi:hypothetical protein